MTTATTTRPEGNFQAEWTRSMAAYALAAGGNDYVARVQELHTEAGYCLDAPEVLPTGAHAALRSAGTGWQVRS